MKEKQPRELVVGLLRKKMNIFVYGTLMDQEIMRHASGSAPMGEKAVLADFGRYRVRDAQYPGIRREQGGQVVGLLYRNVEPDAVHRLDIFEGDLYSRTDIVVQLEGRNEAHQAMTYVVKDKYAHTLSTQEWDFEEFLANGKRLFTTGYHGFDDLEERIGSTGTQEEERT